VLRAIKFFTTFDRIEIQLKYVTLNPFSFKRFISYFLRFPDIEEVLLDTGVETLFHPEFRGLIDYPASYISDYLKVLSYLNTVVAKRATVFAVIPDIPCDYPGRGHLYPYNVKRTIEHIQYFLDKYVNKFRNVTFIPVVQGAKDSISSVINTYKQYYELYRKFEIVAVGPTCTTMKYKKLAKLIITFDIVAEHEYHVFGPSLRTIQLIHDKVKNMRSFDSSAYIKSYVKYKYRGHNGITEALREYMKKLPPNVIY